jgi:hypothetical protein
MPRNEVIEFKVTAEEKAQIRGWASERHKSVSELIRDSVLLSTPPDLEKEQRTTENDPSNLNATLDEKGSVVKDTREEVLRAAKRDSWIASTARILMMETGLSKVAATMQASKEWDKAHG